MPKIVIDAESLPLWDLLHSHQLLGEKILEDAYQAHLDSGKSFAKILVSSGVIQEKDLLNLYADYLSTRVVDLKKFDVPPGLLELVPAQVARSFNILPYEYDGESLGVVAVEPLNMTLCEELNYVLNIPVHILVAKPENVEIAINHYYPNVNESVVSLLDELETIENTEESVATADDANDATIIKFVDAILKKAVIEKASDIHFEPFAAEYRVRCRIDGALYDVESPPKALAAAISSRLKILSNMNISERRVPQDGRIDYSYKGRAVDMRVSTLPTQYGESICVRVLDRANTSLSLDSLGMTDFIKKSIEKIIHKPNGIFIVTGPTGSGKSTTLYSCLNEVNKVDIKLLTAEDPVEYDIEGVMQVAINEKIGLTYARILRAFLRQDPDKIMVGEVRDGETANIAVQAALTGHTVFTTLHTNDAPGTVTRLIDMGVKPFLLSASLLGALGQRLLRRICKECKVSYKPTSKELEQLNLTEEEVKDNPFYYGKGCVACNHTGYKGRVALHEMFEVSPTIKALISKGAATLTLKEQAVKEGMRTMRQHGIEEIFNGATTVEEVTKYT